MNIKIKHLFFISIIFYSTQTYANNENKILFSIGDKVFTSIDLIYRFNYIKLKENKIIEFDEGILNDYISVLLFSKYFDELNLKEEINKLALIELNLIKEYINNNKNKKVIKLLNNIEDIELLKNITFDIKRKMIIENELLLMKDAILTNNINKINNIYEINIKLVSIDNKNRYELNLKNDLDQIINDLQNKQIKYLYKEKKLNFTEKINKSLKISIINNLDYFYMKNSVNTIYGKILRKIKNPKSIKFNLIQIQTNKNLLDNQLTCDKIKILDKKKYNILENEKMDYKNLNNLIKKKLIKVNDFINIKEQNNNNYIVLCKIFYEDTIIENINTNNKINFFAQKIEKDVKNKLIEKYKFRYL